MTDVLSEEELAGVEARANAALTARDGPTRRINRGYLIKTDIPRLLAHIRATSSRPSGAEAKELAKCAQAYLDFISRGSGNGFVKITDPGGREYGPLQSALTVAIAKVERLTIAPQGASEEMVEAALLAYYEEAPWGLKGNREKFLKPMRAALQAALSVKEKKNG